MNNIAIIRQGTGRYLFSVPENVTLREGDHVKCSTNRGITDGIAFADSAWVDENISQLIGKLTGAKFPLRPVVGRLEYLPFEKPEAANSENQYEGMSNKQLDREMCTRGACRARDDGRRKHDCLFADSDCHDVTDSDRSAVIKYLLAEDAEADPKPEENPTEDKTESIKLYCVKDYITPHDNVELIKGTVCTFNPAAGALGLPDGRLIGDATEPRSYDDWKAENPFRAACLVPLVKRPAKVGEWVYITKSHEKRAVNGEIYEVEPYKVNDDLFIKHPDGTRSPDGAANIRDSEYLVLDGYHAEPEKAPEPEYYSGKIICVSSGDECFTVGKMYEFVNGEIKDDDGDERPVFTDDRFKSLEEWNSEYGMPIARFIEFKGEAND